MANDLVRKFVEQELNPGVREILKGALQERESSEKVLRRAFEFNCFGVMFDFVKGVVILQDALASGVDSRVELPILDFIAFCGLSVE